MAPAGVLYGMSKNIFSRAESCGCTSASASSQSPLVLMYLSDGGSHAMTGGSSSDPYPSRSESRYQAVGVVQLAPPVPAVPLPEAPPVLALPAWFAPPLPSPPVPGCPPAPSPPAPVVTPPSIGGKVVLPP